MNKLYLLAMSAIVILAYFASPALADAAQAVLVPAAAACSPGKYGLDLCPLIPVINGLITAAAGLLSASVPVFVGLAVRWLWKHGINVDANTQKVVSDRITATIQNGLKFAISGADVGVSKISIPVQNDTVRAAANYAIAQSPDLLKKAGIDVTTTEGQEALVRRITAEAQPTPAALATPVVVEAGPASKVGG